jgi:uncharacterized protein
VPGTEQAKPVISEDSERSRYELRLDGRLVGVADYRRDGDVLAFTHTGVEPEFRGRGLAAALVDFALSSAREAGLKALPHCWYVRDHIAAHPELLDLVPADRRAEFGLG